MARGDENGLVRSYSRGLSAFPTCLPIPQTWVAWEAVKLLGSAQDSPLLGGRAHRGWTLEERGKEELLPGMENVTILLETGRGRADRSASGVSRQNWE